MFERCLYELDRDGSKGALVASATISVEDANFMRTLAWVRARLGDGRFYYAPSLGGFALYAKDTKERFLVEEIRVKGE